MRLCKSVIFLMCFFQCQHTQRHALLPFLCSSFVFIICLLEKLQSVIPVTNTACSRGTVRVTHKLFFIGVVCYYFGESGGGKASFQMEPGNPSILWSIILHVQKWNAQTSLAVKKSSYHHFQGICHNYLKMWWNFSLSCLWTAFSD